MTELHQKLPKNGFRIYRSTDDTLRMDALINGSAYSLKLPKNIADYAEGYYDTDMGRYDPDMAPIEADGEAPDNPPEQDAPDGGRTDDRSGAAR